MATMHSSTDVDKNGRTILIVEDDEAIGEFIVQAIQQETPHQALRFADGYEAWNLRACLKRS